MMLSHDPSIHRSGPRRPLRKSPRPGNLPHLAGLAAMGLALVTTGCVQYYNKGAAPSADASMHRAHGPAKQSPAARYARSEAAPDRPAGEAPAGAVVRPAGGMSPADQGPSQTTPRSMGQALRLSFVGAPGDFGRASRAATGAAANTSGQAVAAFEGDARGDSTGRGGSQSNLRQVTFTTEGADFDVTAGPSGKTLVFASTRHRKTADIYRKTVGGTAVTQITDDPADDVMPAISPDGKRIAFASDRSGNWDIYITPIDGGAVQQVTHDPTADLHPSFSPDGQRLVYCRYGSASGRWELVLVDLAKPGTRTILGGGMFPQWSPDGSKILFQRSRQRGTRWFSVWTLDLAGGQAVRPTELAVSSNAAVITPAWSPDGSHIVFCTVIDPGADKGSTAPHPTRADVWVMRADGSGRSRLTSGQFANLEPTWAGDGSVFFVSNRAAHGIDNVWMVRPQDAVKLTDRAQAPDTNRATAMAPTP